MQKVKRAILIPLAASLLFLLFSAPIPSMGGRIDLDFKKLTLSAEIREAPIRTVIEKIKEEKGVWFKLWFKEKEFLLDEKISVQFKSLPVQEGLGRIFSEMNHSLIFDEHNRLIGVFLFGKYDKERNRGRRRIVGPGRAPRRPRQR